MAISSPITAEGRAAIIENSNSGYLRLPATRRITQMATWCINAGWLSMANEQPGSVGMNPLRCC